MNNNRSAAAVRHWRAQDVDDATTVISGLLSRHLSLTCGIEERKEGGGGGCSSTDHLAKQTKDPKGNSAANPRPLEFKPSPRL